MGERCPIAGGGSPVEIPEICRENCEKFWDEAVQKIEL